MLKNDKKKVSNEISSSDLDIEQISKNSSIDVKALIIFSMNLPLIAFVVCVLLSLINDFEKSTSTHCKVKNYLPSISASIADFFPQTAIWRLAIALHAFPRYFYSNLHYNYYLSKCPRKKCLIKFAFTLNYIEITCLLLLTYVSSVEYHAGHAISFILFIATSSAYMLITCYLSFKYSKSKRELWSRNYKLFMCLLYFISFMLAFYFYIRHNTYCEPLIYTYFSLSEYIIVFSNILYHWSFKYDFSLDNYKYSIRIIDDNNNNKKLP